MDNKFLALLLVFAVALAVVVNSAYSLAFLGAGVFLSPPEPNTYLANTSLLFMACFVSIFVFLIAWAFTLEK